MELLESQDGVMAVMTDAGVQVLTEEGGGVVATPLGVWLSRIKEWVSEPIPTASAVLAPPAAPEDEPVEAGKRVRGSRGGRKRKPAAKPAAGPSGKAAAKRSGSSGSAIPGVREGEEVAGMIMRLLRDADGPRDRQSLSLLAGLPADSGRLYDGLRKLADSGEIVFEEVVGDNGRSRRMYSLKAAVQA